VSAFGFPTSRCVFMLNANALMFGGGVLADVMARGVSADLLLALAWL